MKKIFLSLILAISFIPFASAQEWQWAHRFGGLNSPSGLNNHPHHLVLDDFGNAYIYGTYGGGTEFNGENLQLFADYNCGSFVAKFDCNGNVVWHKAIARTQNENCNAQYMVLKDNRLYLQGTVHMQPYEPIWFLDSVVSGSALSFHYPDNTFPWISNNYYTYMMVFDLDGNMLDYDLFALYKEDLYSYDGERLGKRTYPLFDQPGDASKPVPFAIDNQHNYYMLSRWRCDGMPDSLGNIIPQKMLLKLNGEDITDTLMPEDTKYVYRLEKFDRNFNHQYSKPLIVNISDTNYKGLDMHFSDMSIDADGNIYISGYAILTYVNGVVPTSMPIDVEFSNDNHIYYYRTQFFDYTNLFEQGFIMKLDSDGNTLWVRHPRNYGAASGSEFYSHLLDEPSGNIYISGAGTPVLSFDASLFTIFGESDTLINTYEPHSSSAAYIVCYDTAGNYKWYSTPHTIGCGIGSVAAYNGKLIAGVMWGTSLTCGETTYYPSEQTMGYSICQWDVQGNITDAMQMHCVAYDRYNYSYDTRVNSTGDVYTAGVFDGSIAFGLDTI